MLLIADNNRFYDMTCHDMINNIYQSMDRSFYSSKKLKSFDKKRPVGFRMLMKRRTNHLLSSPQQQERQSMTCERRSIGFQTSNSSKGLLKFNESLRNQLANQSIKSVKEEHDSMIEKKMRQTSRSKASEHVNILTLPQLCTRIEELIHKKLTKIKSFRAFKETIKEKDQIDVQLDRLIEILNQIQTTDEPEVNLQEHLLLINEKIIMLQKIIAESSTESEMMKKYFHAKRVKRGTKKPYHQYQSLDFMKSQRYLNDHGSKKSIHFSSISKTSFKSPSKNDYPRKLEKPIYKSNNQPLPRSTYSKDYLVYGTLPNFSYRHGQSKILGSNSNFQNRSSYQVQYTHKNTKRTDFKDLDCYKDKFKNLKVSFNQELKKEVSPIKNEYKGYLHPREKAIPQSHYVRNLMSESKVNYDQKMGKKATIKHENLAKLKYSYKSKIHA